MNPFYFGDSSRRLFAIYYPPRGSRVRRQGVVLCYPFGQEYMRGHRAFRQLAQLLVRGGFDVFRFDYHGTGDSDGEGVEARVAEWPDDIGRAIAELQDNGDLKRVSVVGLRLGAALASLAVGGRTDIDRLVLWDPVVSGSAYLDELLSDHSHPQAIEGTVGVRGFPLTEEQRRELAQIDLLATSPGEFTQAHVLVSRDDPRADALAKTWRKQGLAVTIECIPSPGDWNEVDNFGSALVPRDLIQAIVGHLSKETP